MYKKLIVFTSHDLDEEQKKELLVKYNVKKIIFLPEKLQKMWSNVYLDNTYDKNLKLLIKFMLSNLSCRDYVIVQGNWGYTYKIVTVAKENGIIPLYAFTLRVGEDKIVNGEKIRISKFNHIKFLEYK